MRRICLLVYLTLLYAKAQERNDSVQTEDCYSGATVNYSGKHNTTRNGHACLRWDSESLLPHEIFENLTFPENETAEKANNYCRDPNSSGDIWCYTVDRNLGLEKCDISKCVEQEEDLTEEVSTQLFEFENDIWRCRHPTNICTEGETLTCIDTVPTTVIKGCVKFMCCYKRGCMSKTSREYKGTWHHSVSQTECIPWDTITTALFDKSNFPDETLADAKNYCRDPSSYGVPFCYTDQTNKYFCGIPTCSELASRHTFDHDCYTITELDRENPALRDFIHRTSGLCSKRQTLNVYLASDKATYPGCKGCQCCQEKECYKGESYLYKGTWSRSASGRVCRFWSELSIMNFPTYYFPYEQPAESENYCRDFFGSGYTMCHTTDPNIGLEICNLTSTCMDTTPVTAQRFETTTTFPSSTVSLKSLTTWAELFTRTTTFKEGNTDWTTSISVTNQIDFDDCASSPCKNGATCNDYVSYYTCDCTGGWASHNCDQDIDECASSPCMNGTCTNLQNAYSCTCFPDYTAKNCDKLIDTPVDGDWGDWEAWQGCSATCGSGVQKRYRACDNPPPDYGGVPCLGDSYESDVCTSSGSCAVHGNWGAWSSPLACNVTCGQGFTMKVRYCDNPAPSNGGNLCAGNASVAATCSMPACNPPTTYKPFSVDRCPAGYFTCVTGVKTCIKDKLVCDCNGDCDDGSDEIPELAGCATFCKSVARGSTQTLHLLVVSAVLLKRLLDL